MDFDLSPGEWIPLVILARVLCITLPATCPVHGALTLSGDELEKFSSCVAADH